MAELAREGGGYSGATLAPTEISDCFCNLEGEAEPASDRTSGRRKNSRLAGTISPMLLHLTSKQLLVARKPTLMDDLITRNKTALLRNNMERKRASKNKRSDVDSDTESLIRKKMRNNESTLKNNRARKPSEDRKVRVSTRRFMSSLRSGKKRSHIKEASLLERKKRTLKSSGTRSNDSETDTPSSASSSKPNGHPVERSAPKQTEKVEKNSSVSALPEEKRKKKLASDSKPSGSQDEKNEPPIKKIRKKRKKVDSMNWLKKAKQKHHSENKNVDTKIKSEPLSEPEDSGLGSEMRLDLAKSDERLSQSDTISKDSVCAENSNTTDSSSGNVRKPVWTIEPFQVSPYKEPPPNNEVNSSSELFIPTNKINISSEGSPVIKNETDDTPACNKFTTSPPKLESSMIDAGLESVLPEIKSTTQSSIESSTETKLDLDSTEIDLQSDEINQQTAKVDCRPEEIDMERVDIVQEPVKNFLLDTDSEPFSPDCDSQDFTTKELEAALIETKVISPPPELVIGNSDNESRVSLPLVESEENISNSKELGNNGNGDVQLTQTEAASIVDETTLNEGHSESVLDISREPVKSCEPTDLPEKSVNETDKAENKTLISDSVQDVTECIEVINTKVQLEICESVIVSSDINTDICEELVDSSQVIDAIDVKEKMVEETMKGLSGVENSPTLDGVKLCDSSTPEHVTVCREILENGELLSNGGAKIVTEENEKAVKGEEGVERQAEKADWLKALGLQSLKPVPGQMQPASPTKDTKEEKPSKLTEPGYTGTLKAVIKLNKGAPRSIVFKNNEESKPEYQISSEAAASGVPITHLADVSNSKKATKDVVSTDFDTVSNSSYVSGTPQSDSAESDEEKVHGKESNLIIPEKSSSFSIHPGRLCCDVCCYCFGKFGSLDTPCHIAQLKGEERQQKILQNEPYLTVDSCLCDACYRYVDRKANCPSSAAAKTAKRARPPAATLCCVTDCTQPATHSVKRKWLLKIKRSLANKFEIDTEKHTSVFNPLCSNHHYWVDYYMVCGICRKRLNRNHLYTLGPETDKLNLVLAEDGIPARLSDKLFLCKLCRYYANMRLKYSDPSTIPPSSQPFYTNYRKKILASLDVPVSDSDEDKPKPKENKDEDVMSLSGLATLLSDQPEPNQPRIQVKFGNVNIGTLSNLNIGQGRQEERPSYDRTEPSNLPLNATFDFQGPSTSDGSWERVTSTLQFDKKTKQLWQDLQRPYGNQSSFLRHLVILEKYWRCGYLVLSNTADSRASKYISSVQTRNKSFEGKSEVKDIKVETPPPPGEPSQTPPPVQEPILKVPDPSKRFGEEAQSSSKSMESQKVPTSQAFCPIIPTGEVEVLPVNPNSRNIAKEKPANKGTVIIQRPISGQPPPSQSPCKIMITNVQSLAKPKVDPVLLNRAKSLVRMVSPGVSRQRSPVPVPIQRIPTRSPRPRQFQYLQQPYQTLQAQLQAPPSNHPLQSLQQVVLNRYPPPPLVKINQQVTAQQRVPTPRPQSSSVLMSQPSTQPSVSLVPAQQPSVSLIQQQGQPPVSLLQQLQPSVSLIQQPQHSVSLLHQPQTSVSLIHQQPVVTLVPQQQSQINSMQQQPSVSVQLQPQTMGPVHQQPNVSLIPDQSPMSQRAKPVAPPPPYPLRPLLPKLPPSLSISTTPLSTAPSLTPSVSLLPPSSSNGLVPPSVSCSIQSSVSVPLPPVSTLTSSFSLLPPPYSSSSSSHTTTSPSMTPSVSVIPTSSAGNPINIPTSVSLPSSITLPSSGITIEKQPHNFSSPPILPPEKPIISVFREPLPADT